MPIAGTLNTFTANTTARAADVNTNFATLRDAYNTFALFSDVARAITAVQTFSVAPVFSTGFEVAGTLTVSSGGITATGNSTITGTLGGVTTLTCTTVTATSLGGTLTTASQPNITTLAGLTTITVTTATIGTTTGKIVGGSTSLSWRNNADTSDVIKYTESSTTLALAASTLNLNIGASAIVVLGSTSAGQTTINGGTLALVSSASGSISIGVNAAVDVVLSANLATSATVGFVRYPQCSGTPTGAATNGARIFDVTNMKDCVRVAGAWKVSAAYT